MKCGVQHTVPSPAGNKDIVQLFGGYNWRDHTICWTAATKRNGENWIAWLEQLMLVAYPTQTVYLVMDNASFHRSNAVQAAIALFEHRLVVFRLPPYSPELNPIERYWRHLKQHVTGNTLRPSRAELESALIRELDRQNDLTRTDRFTSLD